MSDNIYSGIYKKEPKKEAKLFIVGSNQLKMDTLLIPYYLWETIAHNYMLIKNKLIPEKEGKIILQALLDCSEMYKKNKLIISPRIGDIHENFEFILSKMIGESSQWFHLARSRNDQIATDQKLITKKLFFDFSKRLVEMTKTLGDKAIENNNILMPGFTHLRPAMPSSFGFWFQAYMDQLQEVAMILKSVYETVDKSPLGAGASYGVNWKIDPQSTADNLGFTAVFNNALSAINSRGIHELYWINGLCNFMIIISRMMEDMIIFTLPELGYFSIDESYTTGSSIMPQKMNPDVVESIRSKSAKLLGKYVEIASSMKALPSGYNRDSALSKALVIESFQEIINVLDILTPLIKTIIPNKTRMKNATIPTLAINFVDFLVKKYKIPFRTAHKIIGKALSLADYDVTKINKEILNNSSQLIMNTALIITNEDIKNLLDLEHILNNFSYPGSPNPDSVDKITKKLLTKNEELVNWLNDQEEIFINSKIELEKKVKEYLLQK